jgi:hypothetical protein
MHWVFLVCCLFTTPLVTASNGRRSLFSGSLNCPRSSATAKLDSHSQWTQLELTSKFSYPIISSNNNFYSTGAVSNNWVEVEVKLRLAVSRSVRLGVRHPSGTRDQFFFLHEIFFTQLWVCYFVAPSLTRGRVRNLLLLLVLASAVPWDSTIFYCPSSWDFPNLEGQVPVFISSRNKVAQIYPQALVYLSAASYKSQGYRLGILSRLHTGFELEKLKLSYDRQSVGQSVLVSGTHLGPTTNFSFSLKFSLDSCGFVIL